MKQQTCMHVVTNPAVANSAWFVCCDKQISNAMLAQARPMMMHESFHFHWACTRMNFVSKWPNSGKQIAQDFCTNFPGLSCMLVG